MIKETQLGHFWVDTNTSGLVKRIDFNKKIIEIENKIPSFTELLCTAALNGKATETENKILIILLQKPPEVENKIPVITNFAGKAALNTKAKEIDNKIPNTAGFVTTLEFNRLTNISFDARMKEEP